MAEDKMHYDAIVVGSGISGGWAAKELTEKGLKVLMLERGKNVEHIKDYTNTNKDPWEFPCKMRKGAHGRARRDSSRHSANDAPTHPQRPKACGATTFGRIWKDLRRFEWT